MKGPEVLRRGKEFHKKVQTEWKEASFGKIKKEETQAAGRMDLFTLENSGDVVVVEIKGTDWDRIKSANVRRNLNSH